MRASETHPQTVLQAIHQNDLPAKCLDRLLNNAVGLMVADPGVLEHNHELFLRASDGRLSTRRQNGLATAELGDVTRQLSSPMLVSHTFARGGMAEQRLDMSVSPLDLWGTESPPDTLSAPPRETRTLPAEVDCQTVDIVDMAKLDLPSGDDVGDAPAILSDNDGGLRGKCGRCPRVHS